MTRDVQFLSQLLLDALQNGRREFMLTAPLRGTLDGVPFEIPAGFISDFASDPRFAQIFIENDDPDIEEPSVLHDWLYSQHGRLWLDRRPFTRAECDGILREAMRCNDLAWHRLGKWPFVKRWLVWLGVRLGGWYYWRQPVSRPAAD